MSLKYRIGQLGWYNFETLVQTLLKSVIGNGVTSFGGSKDAGRDATFVGTAPYPSAESPWSGEWIFQAKYVDVEERGVEAARRSLVSALKKEIHLVVPRRRKKKTKRAPDNYLLITNVPLTATNRDRLSQLAADAGLGPRFGAVDGREVCEWLDTYPAVRRAYPQLLALADLDLIINGEVLARSKAYFSQWQPRLATFVATDAYRIARRAS